MPEDTHVGVISKVKNQEQRNVQQKENGKVQCIYLGGMLGSHQK